MIWEFSLVVTKRKKGNFKKLFASIIFATRLDDMRGALRAIHCQTFAKLQAFLFIERVKTCDCSSACAIFISSEHMARDKYGVSHIISFNELYRMASFYLVYTVLFGFLMRQLSSHAQMTFLLYFIQGGRSEAHHHGTNRANDFKRPSPWFSSHHSLG